MPAFRRSDAPLTRRVAWRPSVRSGKSDLVRESDDRGRRSPHTAPVLRCRRSRCHHILILRPVHAPLVRHALIALSIVLPPCVGHAQGENRAPNRELFATALPYPQERGELQLSLGPRYNVWRSDRRAAGELSVEFGITDRWQLELEATAHGTGRRASAASVHFDAVGLGVQRSWMGSATSRWHAALGAAIEVEREQGDGDAAVQAGAEEQATSQHIAVSFSAVRDVERLFGLKLAASATISVPSARVPLRAALRERELSSHLAAMLPLGHVVLSTEVSWSPELLPHVSDSRAIITPGVLLSLPASFQIGIATSQSLARSLRSKDVSVKLIYEF